MPVWGKTLDQHALHALPAAAQMMVVPGATVVTIALPPAGRALHATDENRQPIVTACALASARLLLTGGRLARVHHDR